MSASPRCVVVLGSPKSGTSVTAGVLHHLGFPMGPTLREGDARNPRGYFEDVQLLKLHDRILSAAGGSSWNLPSPEEISVAVEEFRLEISALVAERTEANGAWGLKIGPSVVPYMIDLLPSPHLVLVTRNQFDTAASAVQHVGRPDFDTVTALEHGADTFARSVAVVRTSGLPYTVVSYERLTTDPAMVVAGIAADLGVTDPTRVRAATDIVASRSTITRERRSRGRREQVVALGNTVWRYPRRIINKVRSIAT